jgi:hypothetical protein
VTRPNRPIKPAPNPAADYGAALRVPPAHDAANRAKLWAWLGDAADASEIVGELFVLTPLGWVTARPGDWIILAANGRYHVAAGKPSEPRHG